VKVWSRSFDPHAPRWARTLKEHQRPSFKRHVGPDRVSVDRCACRSFTSASSVVAAQLQVRDDRGDARLRRVDDPGVRRCRGSLPALTLEPRVPPQRLRRGAQASAHEIWLIGRKLAFGPYLRARGGSVNTLVTGAGRTRQLGRGGSHAAALCGHCRGPHPEVAHRAAV
jgi:hypothetical protein